MTPVDLAGLRERVEGFIDEVVIPREREVPAREHPDPDLVWSLQAEARAAGLLAPHVAREWGGLGLDARECAEIFRTAGRSLLGPLALNCAAPDEGNMHLLELVASEAQKERYLRPLAAGDIRSCFAMTEPAPGAGSDPSMLATRAERVSGGWRIDGTKWFITGMAGASFAICMARTSDDERDYATMFLVDASNPGMRISREVPSLDSAFVGGHCEVVFDNCVVPDDAVLGEPGRGYHYAQARLAPARLTHCMRWLGIAERSHEFAVERAAGRRAFGSRLADLGMMQQMIADNEIDLAASRALIRDAAATLDAGDDARLTTSIAKTFVAEAVNRVVDRAVQMCGSDGVSHDLPLAGFLTEVRAFRIYDGPSEVHRWSIARAAVRTAERRIQSRGVAR